MKGSLNDYIRLREKVAYIHGRVERELEAFASTLPITPLELTQRVGALLLGIGIGDDDSLPDLSGGGDHMETGEGSSPSPTVEGLIHAHGSLPQPAEAVNPSEVVKDEVKGRGIKDYWAKMSPSKRRREMERRRKLWPAASRAKWTKKKPAKKKPAKKAATQPAAA